MAQLRSFSSYAPMPNLGGAFTGGYNAAASAAIARDRLAAEAAQASSQMQMQREKLQSDMVQSNMEMAARKEELQSKALREDQELSIQKQYRESMAMMQEKELGQKEQMLKLKINEAANQFNAQQSYQNEAQQLIESGTPEQDAYGRSAMKWGPQMGLPASAYPKPAVNMEGVGVATPIEGIDERFFKKVQRPDGTFAILKIPDIETTEEGVPEGYVRSGGRTLRKVDPPEIRDKVSTLTRLVKLQEADEQRASRYMEELASKNKLPASKRSFIDSYVKREERIEELEAQIAESRQARKPEVQQEPPPPQSKYEEGKLYHNRENKLFRFTDGEMVPEPFGASTSPSPQQFETSEFPRPKKSFNTSAFRGRQQ